jgi:predicted DNA-binding protein (MmcQ/YjbR family)
LSIECYRDFCIALKGVSKEFPFYEYTFVFKIMGKMFALCDINNFESITIKCNPEKAIELREQYSAVLTGYHMNKKHWNKVLINGSISDDIIYQWILDSYNLVKASLTIKQKEELSKLSIK